MRAFVVVALQAARVLAVVAAAGLGPSASAGAAAPPPPIGRTVAPQNPHLAPNPRSNIHDDTWMTDAYAGPGPRGRDAVTSLGPHPPSLCGSLAFDARGRILSVCPSTVAAPVARAFDPRTLAVTATYPLPQAPDPPGTRAFQNFTGGGYFFLDERDRIWSATKTSHLFVLALAADGRSFAKVRDFDLTGVLAGDERVTSALPDFRGRIWFVSKRSGKVGVLDPRSGRVLGVRRLGEEIENSFAVDRDAVYVASDRRLYRFGTDRRGRPRVEWQLTYANSGVVKPGQVDAGTGTTPTIMPGGLVAITDNADPMQVLVVRTARRLAPGRRRTVCAVPVFGRGAGATENSLISAGRSLFVENNYGYQDPFGPLTGALTTPGFARVDVADGRRPRCRVVWTATAERAPSVVSKLSLATGLIYTYTRDPAAAGAQPWSWTAIDARTGRTAFKVAAGDGLTANNNYAGIALGADGTAYLGTIGGLRALRDGA